LRVPRGLVGWDLLSSFGSRCSAVPGAPDAAHADEQTAPQVKSRVVLQV
jgi:hypothetical protein